MATTAVGGLLALAVHSDAAQTGTPTTKTTAVECVKGQTIGAALAGSGPITIVVKGTCTENVLITRDDVQLQADASGGGVTGSPAAPDLSTIVIDGARRVVIKGLTVTGGRNGIVGANGAAFAVLGSTVQNSARNGISLQGGVAHIDGNFVHDHPSSGVRVDGGRATITNNTVEANGQVIDPATRVIGGGISVANAGSALIGLTDEGDEGGNIVQNNVSDGIAIATGSGATLRGNRVLANERYGVLVAKSHVQLEGNNLINGNGATGLFVFEGVVFQQPRSGSLPPMLDTISNNGTTGAPTAGFTRDGIGVFDNSVLDLRGALVTGNAPHGINVSTNSTARLRTNEAIAITTISNNLASGIAVFFNSTATLQTTTGNPSVTLPEKVHITGNGAYGVCRATGAFGTAATTGYLSIQDASTITGNNLGDVNPNGC